MYCLQSTNVEQGEAARQRAAKGTEAVLLSSYGLAHALSMLLPGCRDGSVSQREILKVLFGGGDMVNVERAQQGILGLSRALAGATSDDVVLSEGNSAWVSAKVKLAGEYKRALETHYAADVQTLESADVVNSWVASATRDKITEIVDDDAVAQASLILINALYFKGIWEKPFAK